MRRPRNLRDLFQEFQVLRVLAELVITDHRGKRISTENPELFFVDLLEQGALIEFRGPL